MLLSLIKLALKLAAEGFYEDAIDLLGEGLCMFPFDEKLRGSRGRKYIGAFNYMASNLPIFLWQLS